MKYKALAKKGYVSLMRRETLIVIAVACLLFSLFAVLSKIPILSAEVEHVAAQQSSSLSAIYENPVNAPFKIVGYAFTSFSPTIRMMRAVSFILFIAACVAMFYALKHWHTLQASLLTTAAFATNSIVLASGRLGAPFIAVMSFYTFAGMLLWMMHSRSNKAVPILALISLAGLMYTPGVLWFLGVIAVVYWNRFRRLFRGIKRKALIIGAVISAIIMAPLLLSFYHNPALIRDWLLLPQTISLNSTITSILSVPSSFIYRMPVEPLLNVGRLPVFDIASGILFLIGLNAYRRKLKLDRTRVMLGSALVGIVLGALGQPILATIFLIPFAYSIIAAGIEFLLDEWYSVFPRNPLARSFGMLILTTVVLFSMYYQMTRFFVVWPQAPETRAVYNQTRIIQ
jgi:hypothetical protein